MKILQSKKQSRITLLKEDIKILQSRIRNYKDTIQEHKNQAKKYHEAIISMQKRLRKLKRKLKMLNKGNSNNMVKYYLNCDKQLEVIK